MELRPQLARILAPKLKDFSFENSTNRQVFKKKLPVIKFEVHNVSEIDRVILNDFDKKSNNFWKLKPKLKNFIETQAQS